MTITNELKRMKGAVEGEVCGTFVVGCITSTGEMDGGNAARMATFVPKGCCDMDFVWWDSARQIHEQSIGSLT